MHRSGDDVPYRTCLTTGLADALDADVRLYCSPVVLSAFRDGFEIELVLICDDVAVMDDTTPRYNDRRGCVFDISGNRKL